MSAAGRLGTVRAGFAALLLCLVVTTSAAASSGSPLPARIHLGVASCGSTTCHGRQEATGARVRQNELMTWQDPASLTGAHSRAWAVLAQPRARAIAARLGIGDPGTAAECLGCHGDPVALTGSHGPEWQQRDGVGCEVCHGGAGGWLASHTAVAATHAQNVARGMIPVDSVRTRANLCLDCHFGSNKPGQFVGHRAMAAGHPRLVFELDLFTAQQAHHDEDADYARRKAVPGAVKVWAIGQALATARALALYPARSGGGFPEFSFFDCRSCHRTFSDDPAVPPMARTNPGRPTLPGQPVWNDESMILLAAAARIAAPPLADRYDQQVRAFHASLAGDRAGALRAAAGLSATVGQLAARFETTRFDRAQTLAMLDAVLVGAAARYTDYQGGAQAVMAADTLLSALVAARHADRAAVTAIRPDLERAYAAARDANRWQPQELRAALSAIAVRVRALR